MNTSRRRALAALAFTPLGARAAADATTAPATSSRVETGRLPAPGTYTLPRIMAAPEGTVLDSDGKARSLNQLLRGRISVLSFIYSYCRDPEGCPRAWAALDAVRAGLLQDRPLADRSQIVSLSFDPTNDTPLQMRLVGGDRATDARVRWRFLTTSSVGALLPLLRGFGQEVTIEKDERGHPTRTLNHMLKLFIVDPALQVREVYSIATLAPQAILNDLRTLQRETDPGSR